MKQTIGLKPQADTRYRYRSNPSIGSADIISGISVCQSISRIAISVVH